MDYDNKSYAGLGAPFLFTGQERGMTQTLYNAFNPLHFDPMGRHNKNNTESDMMTVSSLATASADAGSTTGLPVIGVTRQTQ